VIELYLCSCKKIQSLEMKIKKCNVLNTTAITSGYVGRDPQGGTCDGSVR